MKRLGDTEQFVSWKSDGLSNEKLTTPTINDNSLSTSIKWYKNSNFCLIFKLSCLKHKSAACTPPDIIIFFIVYELDTWSTDLNSDFILQDCLVGSFKLAKNADPDKCVYTGYGTEFDLCSEFFITRRERR